MTHSRLPKPLTGTWIGHYVQRGLPRGLRADLTQSGDRLSGEMTDDETDFELSMFEMAAEGGLPPGADEQLSDALRKRFHCSTSTPVRALMTVPAESRLEGEVKGQTTRFTKIYQGSAFCGFRVGELKAGLTVTGHTVHFFGQITEGGDCIDGTWWINAEPRFGVRRTEGIFQLRRE